MSGAVLLSLGGSARGDSTRPGYEGWIEIQSWSWDIGAATSWLKGGGASVGKPTPEALSWTHIFDASAIWIMGHICMGRHFPRVQLHVLRDANEPATVRATLEDVYLTEVATKGGPEGTVQQDVAMVFRTIEIVYESAVRGGAKRAQEIFSWDIATGKASPSGAAAAQTPASESPAAPQSTSGPVDPSTAQPAEPAIVTPIASGAIPDIRPVRPPR